MSIIYIVTYFVYIRNWKKFQDLKTAAYAYNVGDNVTSASNLRKYICSELSNRANKLNTMSYDEWINYNNSNIFLNYNGAKYYFTIYERANSDSTVQDNRFVVRATYPPDLNNLNVEDQMTAVSYNSIAFQAFPLNKNAVNDMWLLKEPFDGCTTFSRYWFNPVAERSIKQQEFFFKYSKKQEGKEFEGIISIGIPVYDLETLHGNLYFNYFGMLHNIGLFLFIFILCYFLKKANNKDSTLSVITFIILSVYLLYTYCKFGSVTTIQLEQKKIDDIMYSVEAVGFLVGVNLFILNSLRKYSNFKYLYNETVFLFCALISFLFIAAFKNTNYADLNEIRKKSIDCEIFFNMSIILNIIVFLNYLYFVGFKKR
jgi:hypothetical protein